MDYRKGQLYIERVNSHKGMYKCTFETSRKVYEGYTDDAYVYDWFNIDPDRHYWSGSVTTLKESRELTRDAWRCAYNIAKEGITR